MKAYIRLLRLPNVLFVGVFQVLLRYCLILPILEMWHVSPVLTNGQFILLVIATMTLTASGNVINDYFDVRCDSINRPSTQVVDKLIDRKTTILIHVLLTLFGLFCGLFLSFVLRRETYALFFVLIPIILWFYSTHFKKQIFIGNLVVATMMAITAIVVVAVEVAAIVESGNVQILGSEACNQAWRLTAIFAFFAFVTNLSREIIKDMEDVEGDLACSCHTIPIEMGIRNSKIVVIMLDIFMMIVLWICYQATTFLHESYYVLIYYAVGVGCPTLYKIYKLIKAHTPHDYHFISILSKVVMMIGMLSIAFIYMIVNL